MIKRLGKEAISTISAYIWRVYQDESKRTTPPYHSLNEVEDSLIKSYKAEDLIIGVYMDDKLEGVALILLDEENNYFSLQGPYIYQSSEYSKVATEIMDYLEDNFKGYKCHFGTTKANVLSQDYLLSKGFICTEDAIQMSVKKSMLKAIDLKENIQLLTEDKMDAYRTFHDTLYHDYYWVADRIYQTMDQWKVHILLDNDTIVGSVFTRARAGRTGEVYGCGVLNTYKNKTVMAELLYISSKSWLDEGVKVIMNFVPEGIDSECAGLVGYEGYDTYMCYLKQQI